MIAGQGPGTRQTNDQLGRDPRFTPKSRGVPENGTPSRRRVRLLPRAACSVGRVDPMARVVVATAFGGPEVLSVISEGIAMPGLGEVRIAVRAAGVNPVDWKRYSGTMGADARLPLRLGFEVAGGRGGRRRGGWPGRACRCG